MPSIDAELTLDPEPRDTGLADCDRCCFAGQGRYWYMAVEVGGKPAGGMMWCDGCRRAVMGEQR